MTSSFIISSFCVATSWIIGSSIPSIFVLSLDSLEQTKVTSLGLKSNVTSETDVFMVAAGFKVLVNS